MNKKIIIFLTSLFLQTINARQILAPGNLSIYNIEETTDPETIKLTLDETKVNFITKRFFDKEKIFSLDIALDISLRNQNQKLLEATIKKLEANQREYPLEKALSIYFEEYFHQKNIVKTGITVLGLTSLYHLFKCYLIIQTYKWSYRYADPAEEFAPSVFIGTAGILTTVIAFINLLHQQKHHLEIFKKLLMSPSFAIKNKSTGNASLKMLYAYLPEKDHHLIDKKLNILC
jgi:hypothetical protein